MVVIAQAPLLARTGASAGMNALTAAMPRRSAPRAGCSRPVDEVETSVGDPGNEFLLSLGQVHEVIAPGDGQGRRTDLAQPVDHGPALVQVRPAKISASGASFERRSRNIMRAAAIRLMCGS